MFNPEEEYNCSPDIKCGGFTELMYYVLYFPKELSRIDELTTPDNIDFKNDQGWTALMLASRNSNTTSSNEVVELLLKKGADPNIKTYNEGYTALMLASSYSATDSNNETVELLLKEGADPNIKIYNEGWTALMMASSYSATDSNNETVELLLKEGADPNIKSANDGTALMLASRYSNNDSTVDTVELLLKNGADPNIKNNNGSTALIYASAYSNTDSTVDTVELLLKNGADPNIKNNNGSTALIYASAYLKTSSIETVELLLKYGADPYEGLKECSTEECKKLVSKYIWKRIRSNIHLISTKYSNQTIISKDIWGLILLRNKQKQLCRNLSSNKNKYVLLEFAEMLLLPVDETTTTAELCRMISKQLTYGEPYSQRSVKYFKRKDKLNIIVEAAKKLGINTNQSINKILDDMNVIMTSLI